MAWHGAIGWIVLGLVVGGTPAHGFQRLFNKADGDYAIVVADISANAVDRACAIDVRSRTAPFARAFLMSSERHGDTLAIQPVAMGRLTRREGGIAVIDKDPDSPADPMTLRDVVTARIDSVSPTADFTHMHIRLAMPEDLPPGPMFSRLTDGIGFAVDIPVERAGENRPIPFHGPLVAEALDVFLACIRNRVPTARL
jgi:hypothetical protein